jgi:hypothetical protein
MIAPACQAGSGAKREKPRLHGVLAGLFLKYPEYTSRVPVPTSGCLRPNFSILGHVAAFHLVRLVFGRNASYDTLRP